MRKTDINEEVKNSILKAAKENRITIHEMAVEEDHVHVFASLPFDMSPSKAHFFLKGRSAYLIFRRFPNFKKRYPKGHFWSRGKFARSVSNVTSSAIKNYIENQEFSKLHETIESAEREPGQLNLKSFL